MASDRPAGPTPRVEALFFDGRTSRAQAVVLSLEEGALCVRMPVLVGGEGDLVAAPVPVSCLTVDEPLGETRRIELPRNPDDQSGLNPYCEVREGPALAAFLSALGYRPSLAIAWQGSLQGTVAAIFGIVLTLAAIYFWGLPPLADGVARLVPASARAGLDRGVIDSLERTGILRPSSLSRQEQDAIRAGLGKLVWPGRPAEAPGISLRFYSAPGVGANAFALPGGTVVVTDQLVKLAESPPAVLAVLGHEAGHVVHRHGLRQLVQASVIGVMVGLWVGDFSSTVTAMSTLALENRYSREFELEADDYGVVVMKGSGLSPSLLADMLERLERAHGGTAGSKGGDTRFLEAILSTHPETAERIKRIRQGV